MYSWDQEDAMAEEQARRNRNTTLPRSLPENIAPQPRSIPEHNVTPLLKRTTAKDLQAARDIVKKALADSSKLNKARVAHPLRNKYGLKPGTIVGGGSAPGKRDAASIKQDVPPLLDITDETAAAAALVAEADAVGGLKNQECHEAGGRSRRGHVLDAKVRLACWNIKSSRTSSW
jgi:hypothetical protein